MRNLLHAALPVLLGTGVQAQSGSPTIEEQKAQYAEFVENAVCTSMESFVGFYVSFRLSGEEEAQSKRRYSDIREAWGPKRIATEKFAMNEKQAELYSQQAFRGAALADKYIEALRAQIEKAAEDFVARFPNERLSPGFDSSHLSDVASNVSEEQKRISNQQERAARIMCNHLVRSSIQEEFARSKPSGSDLKR